jgi:hypothetical protein
MPQSVLTHPLRMILSGLAAATIVATPAQAMCWGSEDVAAAKVRDMTMLLTTVSTRCEAAGKGTSADFQAFTAANRGALSTANQRLKARFWTVYGQEQGQQMYESFVATLTAPYERVPAVAENCAQVTKLAREGAMAGNSVVGLVAVADRNNFTPALPGGVCPQRAVKFAARAMSMDQ